MYISVHACVNAQVTVYTGIHMYANVNMSEVYRFHVCGAVPGMRKENMRGREGKNDDEQGAGQRWASKSRQ